MKRRLIGWLVAPLALAGAAALGVIALALTPWPWRWYESMALPGPAADGAPDVLVVLGGGGIPSSSGLTRTWKAAEAARLFPEAKVIVALPREPGEGEDGPMERELMLRGVEKERLLREGQGRNTREQAVEVRRMLEERGWERAVVGIVTSPDHMKRSWLSFRKAGLSSLVPYPSWPEAIKVSLDYHEAELGGRSLGGVVGGSDTVKYRFWDNLSVLVLCVRETVAIWYYQWQGWAGLFDLDFRQPHGVWCAA